MAARGAAAAAPERPADVPEAATAGAASIERPEDLARRYALQAQKAFAVAFFSDHLVASETGATMRLTLPVGEKPEAA